MNHLDVFLTGGLCLVAALTVFSLKAPAWLFISACGALGLFAVLILPFFVPMTINADPSRKSAVHLGGAQLFGSAVGPLIASLFVTGRSVEGVIVVSVVLLAVSISLAFALNKRPKVQAARGRLQTA